MFFYFDFEMETNSEHIRNFVIIAHIDHGKSTLADRFLELTGTIEKRKMREQFLDQMDLEREKGITIKMQPVRMIYRPAASVNRPRGGLDKNDKNVFGEQSDSSSKAIHQAKRSYILNLIDTPGHADFAYEVSRSLAAVEGALLLVDATQGIQAQTIANFYLAKQEGLVIIPVINKIDLPAAEVSKAEDEIIALAGCGRGDILKVSAKTGEGVEEALRAVIRRVPPPTSSRHAATASHRARALIFDSHFDSFRGIIAHVRLFAGKLSRGGSILMLASDSRAEIMELGFFSPALAQTPSLSAGEIGYVATGLKDTGLVRVGDTVIGGESGDGGREPLPGYREPQPVVFASFYPAEADDYEKLSDALCKIKLNDAAIVFEPEASDALGRGFRAGFLGMLHMEIAQERILREYGLSVIATMPSVMYRLNAPGGKTEYVYSASRFPDRTGNAEVAEPWVALEIVTPQKFLGGAMRVLEMTRGAYVGQQYLGADRLMIVYEVPLKDILIDFADNLKSVTEGYASFHYEALDYRPGDLVRIDTLVAGAREESLARVEAKSESYRIGKSVVSRLKDLLPRQLFPVSLQAVVENRVIARETIPAMKKDVTGYLYGGDRTRKMKLWKKQQRGKKRLEARGAGRVEISPDVFRKLLRREGSS